MAEQHLAQLGHDVAQLFRGRLVAQAQGRLIEAAPAPCVIGELPLREIGVGHADKRVVKLPQPCRAQADFLDGAGRLAKAAKVADTDWLVCEERQTAEDVLQGRAHGQRNGDTAHPEPRDEAIQWGPKPIVDIEDDGDDTHDADGSGNEAQ